MATKLSGCKYSFLPLSNKELLISLKGRLNVATAFITQKNLTSEIKKQSPLSIKIDLSEITHLDDYGAMVIQELKTSPGTRIEHFQIVNVPEKFQKPLSLSKINYHRQIASLTNNKKDNFFVQIGNSTIESLSSLTFFISFIGSIFLSVIQIFKKPKSLRLEDIVSNMKTTGVDGLPVVALISFLLGLIMAFMSSLQLEQFGANIYVASLVALAMVSELGPIMTAIVVAGRSGSAYAAEIGTMKISEEIDALLTMGFNPVTFLVIPRLIAAIIVIPLLAMFSNIFAIAGGLFIGITMLDLTTSSYISQTIKSLTLFEMMWGLSKSVVFSILIAVIGCLRGFQAKGGASSVGNAATSAVVTSIFFIILFDSIFAVIRSYWG